MAQLHNLATFHLTGDGTVDHHMRPTGDLLGVNEWQEGLNAGHPGRWDGDGWRSRAPDGNTVAAVCCCRQVERRI
jgi:hypothetical protein